MAGIRAAAAVLRAVGRASYRELRSLKSITGQNFFFLVLMVAFEQPESAEFFALLVGALLFIPLSSDPLEKIPAERRKLWPLNRGEWLALRWVSILLSPVIWIAGYALIRIGWRLAYQLALTGLAVHGVAWVFKKWAPQFNLLRWVPAPPGVIGQLMRLHWREMLMTLDPYVGLLLSAGTTAYRLSGRPLDPDALPILSMIVVVALSTSAQALMALDGAGAQRYCLLPLRGWQILLAKDLAFLSVLLVLIAPLEVPASLTAALAALAIGHSRAGMPTVTEKRWRFTSGVLWPTGVFQVFAIFAVGNGVLRYGVAFVAMTVAAWVISLWWFGRKVASQ